jgi:hypothetical protein
MLEKNFSNKVLRLLRAEIAGHFRKNPVSAFGGSGVADIIGCVRGRYVELELKAPGKYKDPVAGLSSIQANHGSEIVTNGGIYIIGDRWDDIRDELLVRLND